MSVSGFESWLNTPDPSCRPVRACEVTGHGLLLSHTGFLAPDLVLAQLQWAFEERTKGWSCLPVFLVTLPLKHIAESWVSEEGWVSPLVQPPQTSDPHHKTSQAVWQVS